MGKELWREVDWGVGFCGSVFGVEERGDLMRFEDYGSVESWPVEFVYDQKLWRER